ncbi:MAG: hypothetical protein GX938_09810 [Spirochaetales bacterium]|nr:hypothetical protein [Spirochaetales bacterium]
MGKIFPAGAYFVGDPSFVFFHTQWSLLLKNTNHFQKTEQSYCGWPIFAVPVNNDIGFCKDGDGGHYVLNSGIFGIVPVEVADRSLEKGQIFEFASPFQVRFVNGVFYIGDEVTINTNSVRLAS